MWTQHTLPNMKSLPHLQCFSLKDIKISVYSNVAKISNKGSDNSIVHLVFEISGLYSSSGILNRIL